MSTILELLAKAWPYILAAAVGAFLTHRWDNSSYASLKSDFAVYRAQVATDNKNAANAYAAGLEKQAAEHKANETHNAQVIHDLEQTSADLQLRHTAAVAYIRRLLDEATNAGLARQGAAVPEAGDRPATAPASPEGYLEQVAQLCADTRGEDQHNADQLDALIAEIKPQAQP